MASQASTKNQVSEGTTSAQRILRDVPADPLTYRCPRTRAEAFGQNCPIEEPSQGPDLGEKVALVTGVLGIVAVLLLQALGCIR